MSFMSMNIIEVFFESTFLFDRLKRGKQIILTITIKSIIL